MTKTKGSREALRKTARVVLVLWFTAEIFDRLLRAGVQMEK
jgi:hypothetical protein